MNLYISCSKKINLILSFIFIQRFALCQIYGYVLDKKIQKPIQYAQVICNNLSTYTDEKGSFRLNLPDNTSPKDTIFIMALGYDTLRILVGSFENNKKFLLPPSADLIEEIKVKAKNKKRVRIIGEKKNISIFSNDVRNYHLLRNLQGIKHVMYIPNDYDKELFVEGLYIYLIKTNVASRDPITKKKLKAHYPKSIRIRVRCLSVKNQLPYQDVTKENLIFEISSYKPQWLDISSYNIVIPAEGIFIGWELLEYNYKIDSSGDIDFPIFYNKNEKVNSFSTGSVKWYASKGSYGFRVKVSYYE